MNVRLTMKGTTNRSNLDTGDVSVWDKMHAHGFIYLNGANSTLSVFPNAWSPALVAAYGAPKASGMIPAMLPIDKQVREIQQAMHEPYTDSRLADINNTTVATGN